MDDNNFVKVEPEIFEMYEKGQWEEAFRKIWMGLMLISGISFAVSVWLLAFGLINWLFPLMWAIILTVVATLPTSSKKKS